MNSQILFVQGTPPHGSMIGQEGLDACLMGSAFADCALLFLGDGIFQVLGPQDTSTLGVKNYSVSYGALRDYGLSKIYCRQSDLEQRGLSSDELVIEVTALSDEEALHLMTGAAQVLTF